MRLALPQLHQQVLGRHGRERVQHARAAERDRLAARARDHELVGAGRAQLVVEREVERALRQSLEPPGDAHGAVEVLAHAQVERRARQAERVGEALAHLGVEPAVDAARQEHDREREHEQERRDREAAEHQERAAAQARARHVAAPVAHEVREPAADQDQQRDDAGDVDEQDEEVQLAEALRSLGRHRQHDERRDPDHEARADDERQPAPDHGRTFQAYHSVLRDQSFQNSSMRTAAGSSPTSTVARTRMSKRRPSGSVAVLRDDDPADSRERLERIGLARVADVGAARGIGDDEAFRDRVVGDLPAARHRDDFLVREQAALDGRLDLEPEHERHALLERLARRFRESEVEADVELPGAVHELDVGVPDLEAAGILRTRGERDRGAAEQGECKQPATSPHRSPQARFSRQA